MNKLLKIFASSLAFLFVACAKDSFNLVNNVKWSQENFYTVFSKVNSKANTISSQAANYLSSSNISSTNSLLPNSFFSSFELFSDEITALTVAKDGLRAFIGSDKGSVYTVSLDMPERKNKQAVFSKDLVLEEILKSKRPINSMAVSPNGKFLAISQFSIVVIYDLEKKEIVHKMTRIPGRITTVAWDPRGELLAFGCSSGESYIWQLSGKYIYAGEDTLSALEKYGNPTGSPIEEIIFHPSSRVLITAAKNNRVTFWRLLRTEKEMGLVDNDQEVYFKSNKTKSEELPRLGANLEDLVLTKDFSKILVLTTDGKLSVFKVRGLERLGEITFNKEFPFSYKYFESRGAQLSVSSTRSQKIRIDCGIGDIGANSSLLASNKTSDNLYESSVFGVPLNKIYLSANSSILWIVQKNGRLMTLNLQDLNKLPDFNKRIAECSSYT